MHGYASFAHNFFKKISFQRKKITHAAYLKALLDGGNTLIHHQNHLLHLRSSENEKGVACGRANTLLP
jgi:hypothetical protein